MLYVARVATDRLIQCVSEYATNMPPIVLAYAALKSGRVSVEGDAPTFKQSDYQLFRRLKALRENGTMNLAEPIRSLIAILMQLGQVLDASFLPKILLMLEEVFEGSLLFVKIVL